MPSVRVLLGTVLLLSTALASHTYAQNASEETLPDHLLEPMGFEVTTGAAPGYIEDEACGVCHSGLFESYKEVGMSRSFTRPRPSVFIENFDAEPYFHEPSQRYYQILRRGGDLVFHRFQLDDEGDQINIFEQKVDWILGSGNKTRSYLYQTRSGELYQLPIGWYTETGQWRMAPGYDTPQHDGVERPVRRECMFCHNGYPEVPEGSDTHWAPHIFPSDLPEGTGCQRCHGPGAAHIRTVLDGGERDAIRAAIVNPARLPVAERDSICFQCHLLPAVSLIGIRRLERPDYSFRPGELLSDYQVHVDIDVPDMPRSERFEINHHGYRLRQSPCFTESEGALTCITCHDPHRKVAEEERAAHFASICLSCHEPHEPPESAGSPARTDCVSCHMPQRRTQDVVHVVMTDHFIQRNAAPPSDRLAPLSERSHLITDVELLMPERAPDGLLSEAYLVITKLRAQATPALVDRLEEIVAEVGSKQPELELDLARGQLLVRRNEQARRTLGRILERDPRNSRALQWLGIVLMNLRELDESEAALRKALAMGDVSPELNFNLGLVLLGQGRIDESRAQLEIAVEKRSNLASGWYYLGVIAADRDEPETTIRHLESVLAIDPTHTRAYLKLAEVLRSSGHPERAERYLRHARNVASDPAAIDEALRQ